MKDKADKYNHLVNLLLHMVQQDDWASDCHESGDRYESGDGKIESFTRGCSTPVERAILETILQAGARMDIEPNPVSIMAEARVTVLNMMALSGWFGEPDWSAE